jgi:16S rRNA processing protein RimM
MENLFNIGKIVNTHGIRGEVKIYPYSDELENFKRFKHLIVLGSPIEIETARVHKGMVLVKFKGYEDANQVTALMNQLVFIERDIVGEPEEGHFIVDLIGSSIIDQNDVLVGHLVDVLQNTTQDLYEIKRVDGKGVFLLPVVDAFVKSIDISKKVIHVFLIEGIMDEV